MAELCQREYFSNPETMVQRDQLFLCGKIHEKTGILISLSTIKRLLNNRFAHLPQIATLDAIAKSAGYETWQDFKSAKNKENEITTQVRVSRKEIPAKVIRNKFNNALPLLTFIVLLFFTIGFLALKRRAEINIAHPEKAKFTAIKTTGNDIPNTVVFKYDIDSVMADSFFIQQSWDKNRRVKVYKNTHTLTDIYYEPGYHTAKLIANNSIIKTVDVSIPTDRWFFYSKDTARKSKPQYIMPANHGINDGSLQLTRNDLLNNKIDIQKPTEYYQVYFPSQIKESCDNFILKFRIKINKLHNESCPFLISEVYSQKYFMYFLSTLKGCTSELGAQFGENNLSGKTNDLSALGTNLNTWQNIDFKVINKKVSISINHVEVYTASYKESCGKITGLGFISNGLPQVDFVKLETPDGRQVYNNDFGH